MLRPEIREGCVYGEFLTEDARLVLANIRAAAERGACIANYVTIEAVAGQRGDFRLEGRCTLTGELLMLRARHVVNATGPWIQSLLSWYYDPMYDYQLEKKEARIIFRGDRQAVREFLETYEPTG